MWAKPRVTLPKTNFRTSLCRPEAERERKRLHLWNRAFTKLGFHPLRRGVFAAASRSSRAQSKNYVAPLERASDSLLTDRFHACKFGRGDILGTKSWTNAASASSPSPITFTAPGPGSSLLESILMEQCGSRGARRWRSGGGFFSSIHFIVLELLLSQP